MLSRDIVITRRVDALKTIEKANLNLLKKLSLVTFVSASQIHFTATVQAQSQSQVQSQLQVHGQVAVKAKTEHYLSKGKPIRVDWIRPAVDSGKPVVLILYGSSGSDPNDYFHGCAEQLAAAGFVVGIIHYFDSVNIKWADSSKMSKYFSYWLGTVGDAVTYSQKQFGSGRKIYLFGYSLGAQLSLTTAARDERIGAVSSMSGCFVLPPPKSGRMPPVLLLHGDRDYTVPLQREKRTEAQLKLLKAAIETHIYPKQGHCFDAALAQDAIVRTIGFFDKTARK
ncbi:hypothetical protein BH11CYA1_BH11CYA1_37510 [soil metagenome]